jgi:hypothetical protein
MLDRESIIKFMEEALTLIQSSRLRNPRKREEKV